MYLTSEIVNDTLAARRFRLLAPLAVLLALAALTLAPGIFGIRYNDAERAARFVHVKKWCCIETQSGSD